MSVPNRSEDRIDDPSSYEPRWVRRSQPIEAEQSTATRAPSTAPAITSEAAHRITNAPLMARGIGGYNIDLPPPKSHPLQGDAIKDARRQQSLEPQSVPEPPVQKERKSLARWHGWLSCVAIVAVIIGLAV